MRLLEINGITGRAVVDISGIRRSLAFDMNAAAWLFAAEGELWPYWVAERCAGRMMRISGQSVRVVDQMSDQVLASLLIALLSTDRAVMGSHDTPELLLSAIGQDGLLDAQQMVVRVIQPTFEIPGKGLVKEKRRRVKKRKEPWDWKSILQCAFGPFRLSPEEFWKTTLVEWGMLVSGSGERERISMRKLAWLSRNQLIAAGADSDKVTVAKLLGEKEPRRRRDYVDDDTRKKREAAKVIAKIRNQRTKREQTSIAEIQPVGSEVK